MTTSSVETIIDRIKSANFDSPIAVFIEHPRKLNAVFANTIHSQRLIYQGVDLVGVYHKGMIQYQIKQELLQAISRANYGFR